MVLSQERERGRKRKREVIILALGWTGEVSGEVVAKREVLVCVLGVFRELETEEGSGDVGI